MYKNFNQMIKLSFTLIKSVTLFTLLNQKGLKTSENRIFCDNLSKD